MRTAFIIFIISAACNVSAQMDSVFISPTVFTWFNPTQLHLADSGNVAMHVGSEFLLGSSAQPVAFTDKLLFGGYISDPEKDNVRTQLRDLNYGGIDFETDVYLSIKTDSLWKNSAIFFGGGYSYFQSLAYTRDFFNIAFYGNKLYEGDSAVFSDSGFDGYSLVEYKAGYVKQWNTLNGNFILGISGGFVQGLSARNARIDNGLIYTAQDGQYLDIALDFAYNNTGTAPVDFQNTKGTGYSFDVFAALHNSDQQFEIQASVQDLGKMYWDVTPFNYTADTNYTFEGIDISYVFNASGTNADGSNDSIYDILGIDTTAIAFQTAIPAKCNISFTKYFNGSGLFVNGGAQYYLFTPYQIFIYGRFGKYFSKNNLEISAILNIGGYGSYGIGFDLEKKIWDNVYLRIGSNSLLGFIAPDYFKTASVFGTVRKTF